MRRYFFLVEYYSRESLTLPGVASPHTGHRQPAPRMRAMRQLQKFAHGYRYIDSKLQGRDVQSAPMLTRKPPRRGKLAADDYVEPVEQRPRFSRPRPWSD